MRALWLLFWAINHVKGSSGSFLQPSYPRRIGDPSRRVRSADDLGHQIAGQPGVLLRLLDADKAVEGDDADSAIFESIRCMKIRDIKKELEALDPISTRGILEKDELVRRLVEARSRRRQWNERRGPRGKIVTAQPTDSQKSFSTITTPLYWTSLGSNRRITADAVVSGGSSSCADNVRGGSGGGSGRGFEMAIENTSEYATIRVDVVPSFASAATTTTTCLNLLVDTACSGVVLRPEVAKRCDLPTLRTPVLMTGAGGATTSGGATAVALEFCIQERKFGPMPAAVQDIGALPPSVDGILGVSFLSLFDSVTMDFSRDVLILKEPRQNLQHDGSASGRQVTGGVVVAESEMDLLGSWGICSVPVWLGSRGPVKMLMDTGAACTLLHSPMGTRALGLDASRDTSVIAPLPGNAGAMGGDNVAIRLTHRLYLSSSVCLGSKNPQLQLQQVAGVKLKRRVAVDMGSIPFLDQLQPYQVGGILGMDVLSQCDAVEVSLRGPRRFLKLLMCDNENGGRDREDSCDAP